MKYIAMIFTLLLMSSTPYAGSSSPENAKLYFISPANNAVVSNPVHIQFGLKNMGVAPAGIKLDATGHHHLLINTGLPVLDRPVPSDAKHRHFGMGQTEATLELPPGKHRLQLLLGDFAHIPHQPAVMSEVITITVE